MAALAAEVVKLSNAERDKAGCDAPLRVDDRLVAAARGHSEDMAARDYFDHVSPEGDGPGERTAAEGYPQWSGENLALGYSTAEDVVAGWMRSDGHRRNILNCDSVAVGVGAADSEKGIYWTQIFGFV
ncbi:MAG: CAP domain-containing protein [Jiangellaceae bacterium]|nr:CAP domain-containing protein [Jiangellaceae bacterium]